MEALCACGIYIYTHICVYVCALVILKRMGWMLRGTLVLPFYVCVCVREVDRMFVCVLVMVACIWVC